MLYEICVSAETWQNIKEKLLTMPKLTLLQALRSQKLIECLHDRKVNAPNAHIIATQYMSTMKSLSHEQIVEECFRLIKRNNTCNIEEQSYWIDREGNYKVYL